MRKNSERPFNSPVSFVGLDEVKITDPYLLNAAKKELDYLLVLDADRLLYYFYINAALSPKASSSYGGGWEGALVGGHTLGHYLTALSQAVAGATTPETLKPELRARIVYITTELKKCQDNAVKAGTRKGFIWGASLTATGGSDNFEYQFDDVEINGNGFSPDCWVPWYTMHKLIAGLLSCTVLVGDATAKEVLTSLGDWVCDRTARWTPEVRKRVLSVEYGGMNDCMYGLYALTNDGKYMEAAQRFDEEELFSRVLAEPKDYLDGVHANTTIPKIIGALKRYVFTEHFAPDAEYFTAVVEKFWDFVVARHTYVTGGNSENEHFGKDDVLDAERTELNCETCNSYNMLKLSRLLFAVTEDPKYLDYYENTFYNSIISSQNPETGMTTYFQPMASGYFKVFSTPTENFWCCTGTGMESFTKLSDGIYYKSQGAVCVSEYIASELRSENVSFTMDADLLSSDRAEISVTRGGATLVLRRPFWSETFSVKLNGKRVSVGKSARFVSFAVKDGDRVEILLRKRIVAYGLKDSNSVYAFKYGPFVLSAKLGKENMTTTSVGAGVTVPERDCTVPLSVKVVNGTVENYIAHIEENLVPNARGGFDLLGVDVPLEYIPHYLNYNERYGIYCEFLK